MGHSCRAPRALLLSAFIGVHRRLTLLCSADTRFSSHRGRPGRSEQVSQSDSSAASIHWVDLRRSEARLGAADKSVRAPRHCSRRSLDAEKWILAQVRTTSSAPASLDLAVHRRLGGLPGRIERVASDYAIVSMAESEGSPAPRTESITGAVTNLLAPRSDFR